MSAVALALVAAAAVMHVGWNTLAKRATDRVLFLWMAMALPAILLAPWALSREHISALAEWPVAATATIHVFYFTALGRAYSHGDLSQVYPISRGLSVALVTAGAWLILDEPLPPIGVAGIALVLAGVLSVGIDRRAARPAVMWAVITGLLVTSYSLVDKVGVSRVDPVFYVTCIGAGSSLLLSPWVIHRRRALAAEWRTSWRSILAAAALGLTAYLLVLFAFSLSKAAYVVASRELSIVASVVIGRVALGEAPSRQRVIGAVLIAAGVAVLAVAG